MSIFLGTVRAPSFCTQPTQLIAASPRVERFTRNPAVLHDLAERLHLPIQATEPPPPTPYHLDPALLDVHGLLSGSSGSGKSSLKTLITADLLRAGTSVVEIDPKLETLMSSLRRCRLIGLPPSRVFLFSPQVIGAIPRWPYFAQNLPSRQLVSSLVEVVEQHASPGARRHDLLTMTGLLLAEADRRFSPDDLLYAVQHLPFAEAVARLPGDRSDPFAWATVEQFLQERRSWSKMMEAEAIPAATRVLRELVSGRMLYGTLSADVSAGQAMLQLEQLWQEPYYVGVHLQAEALGQQGSSILAALLVRSLFAHARNTTHPSRRVVLAIDEMPELARFIAGDLNRVLAMARSMNLSLLMSCQAVEQMPELADALLKQPAVQVNFKTDYLEARRIAAAVMAGTAGPLEQVTVDAEVENGELCTTMVRLPLVDQYRFPVRIRPDVWRLLAQDYEYRGIPIVDLNRLAGGQALCVRDAALNTTTTLSDYLRQLVPCKYWVDAPDLHLNVVVPRLKMIRQQRRSESELQALLTQTIQQLPTRHSLLRVHNRLAGILSVTEGPELTWDSDDESYLTEALRLNGQSDGQIIATLRKRAAYREELCRGSRAQAKGASRDASPWE